MDILYSWRILVYNLVGYLYILPHKNKLLVHLSPYIDYLDHMAKDYMGSSFLPLKWMDRLLPM